MTVLKVPSDMVVESKKKHKIESVIHNDMPPSYTSNTTKEETILEYVEDFRRQFVQVFPDRRPLLLCPLNESGVRKFVCTTLRPSLLPSDHVYDLKDTAEFVADFLEYMELDEPTRLPDILPSPTSTAALRSGDCLDFANFLASLLRGAAYDAYVVSGYAPKDVCFRDQTQTECPILEETENPLDRERRLKNEKKKREKDDEHEAAMVLKEVPDGDEAEGEEIEGGEAEKEPEPVVDDKPKEKYQKKRQPDHNSKFQKMKERLLREEEAKKQLELEQKSQFVADQAEDPLGGSRVHCWVLVMAGKRDITENLYVEPTTGTIYKATESPYLGVESVWNEQNYWANIQTESAQEMSFNLKDSNCWEYVLIEEALAALDAMDHFDGSDPKPEEQPSEIPPEEAFDDREILDCPMSWCKRITIDRLVFRDRYPKRIRSTDYRKCTVQKYAPHLESSNGVVLRVLLFQTEQCITPLEIRERFVARADKLHSRYIYPLADRVHMMYEPGKKYGLKDYIKEKTKRTYTFYPKARVDGMVTRNELIGEKVVEEFQERDDFLVYRSVRVTPETHGLASYAVELAPRTEAENAGKPVVKMTLKFARNEDVDADADVRKRTHFIADQKIRLDYHYAKRRITARSVVLDKTDRQISGDTLGEFDYSGRGREANEKPNPHAKEHKELLAKLLIKEKDLFSEVRDEEKEMTKLLHDLDQEGKDVRLEKTIYDLAQEQKDEDLEKEDEVDEKMDKNKVDYLSPFLAQYKGTLNYRDALSAKAECLAALKERLLERANIIQQHLDEENTKLNTKRTQFKRQTGSAGAVEADEEFTQFYEQSAFRIDILRARLAKHEDLAVKKYIAMDERLNNDPRLRALNQGPDGAK